MVARHTPLTSDVVNGTGCLPPVLAALLALTREARPCPDTRPRIAQVLGSDPLLCLQLLPYAGEAAAPLTITGLLDACGIERLQALVLRIAWRQQRQAPHGPRMLALGQRLLRTALLARALARAGAYHDAEEAHCAALLLFSGQLLMALHGGADYARLIDEAGDDRRQQLAREAAHYGATHAQLGLSLLADAALSPAALDVLRYQGVAMERLDHAHPLTRLLMLADQLAGTGPGTIATELAQRWFALPAERVHACLAESEHAWQAHLPWLVSAPTADCLQEALTLPQLFPRATSAVDAESVWRRIAAALEVHFGFEHLLLFRLEADGRTLASVLHPQLRGQRLPRSAGLSLVCDASLEDRPRDSHDGLSRGQGVVDEQLSRLLDTQDLFCLPFSAGVVVIGVGPDERARCLERLPALNALLAAAAASLPAPAAEPDLRLREARHELAAPLTTLGNYLHLLAAKAPDATEELRIAREELARLRTLVERLGAPACAQAAAPAPVDLKLLLQDLAASARLANPRAQIEVLTDPTLPPVHTDPVMLRQVLGNLLHNALEAPPAGGAVRLESGWLHDAAQGAVVGIVVTDDGPGIPPAVLARLYEPKTEPRPGHEGLGLAIVKQLCDALGAGISCRSSAAIGTRFELRLARDAATPDHQE